ncbi:MAG TPA: hypothetical protein VKE96_28740 [Vicinamibacterales bacterium]|nr:hypothetical protein [Vicinamibacterales bacterium]
MIDPGHRRTYGAAALFAALTLIATFPIILAPGSYTFFTHSDAQLNMWIMAWDAHALAHSPLHLLDANIFVPEPGTLLYSETLLGYAPIFAPIFWLGGTPPLANNAVFLFSVAASGITMYLLARHLTGRHWPAIAAGIAYAFVPYRFVHIPQIQLTALEWIPLAFLCLHLLVERGAVRYAVGLGASVAMQAYCCVYYSVFLAIALVAGGVVLFVTDARARSKRTIALLAATGFATAVAVAPLLAAYERVHRTRGLTRSIEEIAARSAVVSTYFASTSRLHQWLWAGLPLRPRDYLYPGMLATALAALGIVTAMVRSKHWPDLSTRRSTVVMYAAIALVGLAASFGPDGIAGMSLYRPLAAGVPLLQGLRQTTRFGILVIFGVGVLSAFGAARLEPALRRFGVAGPALLAALIFVDVLVAPLRTDRPDGDALVRVPETPPVYRWLADQPGKFAILELPYAPEGLLWQNASYVYWSTVHWHGVVDAYSGFASPDYRSLTRILDGFPDELSRQALLKRHVLFVIVHRDRYQGWNRPLNYPRIDRTQWLSRVAQFPGVDVLRVDPEAGLLTDAR